MFFYFLQVKRVVASELKRKSLKRLRTYEGKVSTAQRSAAVQKFCKRKSAAYVIAKIALENAELLRPGATEMPVLEKEKLESEPMDKSISEIPVLHKIPFIEKTSDLSIVGDVQVQTFSVKEETDAEAKGI